MLCPERAMRVKMLSQETRAYEEFVRQEKQKWPYSAGKKYAPFKLPYECATSHPFHPLSHHRHPFSGFYGDGEQW